MIKNLNCDYIHGDVFDYKKSRKLFRRFFSKIFTIYCNIMFIEKIRYYNGIPLIKNNIFKKLKVKSSGPFFMAEIFLKIIKNRIKYKLVKIQVRERRHGKSKIFTFKVILITLFDSLKLRFGINKLFLH